MKTSHAKSYLGIPLGPGIGNPAVVLPLGQAGSLVLVVVIRVVAVDLHGGGVLAWGQSRVVQWGWLQGKRPERRARSLDGNSAKSQVRRRSLVK